MKWSGFITKNGNVKDKVHVDAYLMSGIFPDNVMFNLNITALAAPSEALAQRPDCVVAFVCSEEPHEALFRELMGYIGLK